LLWYSEKDYTDGMSDDEALSGLGSVSEDIEGTSVADDITTSQHTTGDRRMDRLTTPITIRPLSDTVPS